MYLEQQVVDGCLHFQGEAVARIVLAEVELVIYAEDGHGRDGCTGLRGLLVLLAALHHFDLQLLQLCPGGEVYDDLKKSFGLKPTDSMTNASLGKENKV